MDKYRRNDDVNDDLEAYNGEMYEGLSIVDSKNAQQPTHVTGSSPADQEFLERLNSAVKRLSAREIEVMELVVYKGLSISHAARRLGISQPRAQKCWNNIREKLQ